MKMKKLYNFKKNEILYMEYDFLRCDECKIFGDRNYAYHYILEVKNGKERRKYDLYWDYGDNAIRYVYDKFNLVMKIAYGKNLEINDSAIKTIDKYLIYLPEDEEFRIIIVALYEDGKKTIFFASPKFPYPKDKYLENFDWKRNKDKIYMKRPYYIVISPFLLPDILEGQASARDDILELHLRFRDQKTEIVIPEDNEEYGKEI